MTVAVSTATAKQPGVLPFAVLIGGQLLSFISTTLTAMAVGIWIFNQSGSVVTFASLTILTLLPAILISPFGGVIADRFPRKPMMLLVDGLSAATSLTMVALLAAGRLDLWFLYVNAVVSGISLGMQRPLYESITPLMVPKQSLAFVNGIVQSVAGIGQVAAPALAGLLLGMGLKWIFILDLATFLIALCCILLVKVPDPVRDGSAQENWFAAFARGWRFIRERPGLHTLLWFVAARNFLFAACEVVIIPLLLVVTTPQKAGIVLSVGGLGIIAGGLLMGLLARSRRLIVWVILAQGLTGIAMVVGGLVTDLTVIAAILALAFLAFPVEEASSTTILQRKVPTALLGRVSSVRSMMTMSAPPLAMLVAAPLADRVFEPMMRDGGSWTGILGPLVGTGEGRGMALLILLTGLVTLALTVVGWLNRGLRNVETDLPDQEHVVEVAAGEIHKARELAPGTR